MKLQLKWKAQLENVTNVTTENEYTYSLKITCLGCNEEHEKWVEVTALEKSSMPGSKGEANLVMKCKLCRRDLSLDILTEHRDRGLDPDITAFIPLATFDCRGLDVSKFRFGQGFQAQGIDSNHRFSGIDLSENEWADYDEDAKLPVGITEVEYQFVKL